MDCYKKAVRSQPFGGIPASLNNDTIDVVQNSKQREHSLRGGPRFSSLKFAYIVNATESYLDKFSILAIGGLAFDPTNQPEEFQDKIVFTGTSPAAGNSFAIITEPAEPSQIVKAKVSGETQVKIDITDESHTCADVKDGDSTQLQSVESGPAQIIWKETGTGTKWAVVRFGGSGGGGGSGIIQVEIVEGLSYPSPESPDDTDTYQGRSWYNCKLVGSSPTTPWELDQDYVGYNNDPANASIVSDGGIDYKCLISHKSTDENRPDPTRPKTAWWEKVESIRIDRFLGFESRGALDMRNSDVWFEKGDRPLAMKIGDYYYFVSPCPEYSGEPDYANNRYNTSRKHKMSVFA
jgi:hypothetical protein